MIGLMGLLFVGCKNETATPQDTSVENSLETIEAVAGEELRVAVDSAEDREPTDEEIRGYGILKAAEDAQYPLFIVTIEFPEQQSQADFNVNIEAISQTTDYLNSAIGKYVSFYYEDTSEHIVMDLQKDGVSLYGDAAPEIDASLKSITGVLQGAETETAGDVPDTITITTTDDKALSFKEFITPEIVANNGNQVTAYYYMNYNQTITYFKQSEN